MRASDTCTCAPWVSGQDGAQEYEALFSSGPKMAMKLLKTTDVIILMGVLAQPMTGCAGAEPATVVPLSPVTGAAPDGNATRRPDPAVTPTAPDTSATPASLALYVHGRATGDAAKEATIGRLAADVKRIRQDLKKELNSSRDKFAILVAAGFAMVAIVASLGFSFLYQVWSVAREEWDYTENILLKVLKKKEASKDLCVKLAKQLKGTREVVEKFKIRGLRLSILIGMSGLLTIVAGGIGYLCPNDLCFALSVSSLIVSLAFVLILLSLGQLHKPMTHLQNLRIAILRAKYESCTWSKSIFGAADAWPSDVRDQMWEYRAWQCVKVHVRSLLGRCKLHATAGDAEITETTSADADPKGKSS